MRTSAKRPLLAGMMSLGLLFSLTGCKSGFSPPSMDWLSWGKKSPSATALSSATPKKPSTTSLPSPAATTGMTAQTNGSMGGLNSPPPNSTPYGRSSSNPTGYYPTPYGTGQTMPGPAGSVAGAYPAGSYPSGITPYGTTTNPGSFSPYQSPGSSSGDYRTADARGSSLNPGAFSMPSPSPPVTPSAAGSPGTWSAGSAGRGTGAYGPVEPAGYGGSSGMSYPQAGAPPAGAAPVEASYGTDPRAWNPSATPASASPYRSGTGFGGSTPTGGTPGAGLSPQSGAYRPGSTSRVTSPLGSGSSASPATGGTATPNSGTYPATSAATSPTQSPSYGSYGYPSTGQ